MLSTDNREDQLATTITSFSKMQDKHAEKEADWSRERAVLAGQLTDLQSERDRLKTSELELQSRVRELGSELSRAHADSALKQAQLDIAVAAANETRGEALKYVRGSTL